jgi:S1-C subfamily serine protease
MRMAFGLVSLLVVIAIMLVLFKTFEAPTIETGQKAKDQAIQISGRGHDGGDALSSFAVQPKRRGSTLDGLTVVSVQPGGAMADYYGIQPGDEIVSVDGMKLGDIANDDVDTAKAMLVQRGYQASAPILVIRNGQQFNLPDQKNLAATAAPAPTATAPAATNAPPANNPPAGNSVQDQLKNLGIQTH